jgi:signal recognition particle subunit SRP14
MIDGVKKTNFCHCFDWSCVFLMPSFLVLQVLLQLDPFLNELTSMFEKSKEKGSVWVTLKRCNFENLILHFCYMFILEISFWRYLIWFLLLVSASLKSKVQKRKLSSVGESIEYRCLIRATDGKKTVSTSVCSTHYLKIMISNHVCFQT